MQISATGETSQATTVTRSAAATDDAAKNDAASALSSDFETFLKMLTVQMENQDPLNPIKSEDFAMQLATFSGVEQQVRTNDLLGQIADGLGGGGLSELGSWIGLDVRAAFPVPFDGTPLSLHTNPDPDADRAVLVVRDDAGAVVQRQNFDPGETDITWAGTDEDGNPLAKGTYSFSVESYKDNELLGTSGAESFARITEARVRDGAIELVTADGAEVSADDVSAVRESASQET